jgi:hypothetical protein
MGLMLLCQQPPYSREHPIPTCIELYEYEKVDAAVLCKTFPCEGAKKDNYSKQGLEIKDTMY